MDVTTEAIKTLIDGGIAIYPTDTAFGIGCRIDRPESVDRLFSLRKRPLAQATPVLVASIEMALVYFDNPSDIVRRLMDDHWPGALTIVAECKKQVSRTATNAVGNRHSSRARTETSTRGKSGSRNFHFEIPDRDLIYSPIRGGGNTIGLRMPNHETALAIIRGVGVPILGPSANFHGAPTPYREVDLDPEFVKLVDLVVPGTCSVGNVSTVVDCSVDPFKIIRQGAVKLNEGVNCNTDRDVKICL